MEKSVARVGYDVEKLPLGNLSQKSVAKGYGFLTEIETILSQISAGKCKLASKYKKLQDLSGSFYTYIPHEFGFQKMRNFVIDSEDTLKEKMELVSNLIDINTAVKLKAKSHEEEVK